VTDLRTGHFGWDFFGMYPGGINEGFMTFQIEGRMLEAIVRNLNVGEV
jgi:hypothetical protein